MDMSSSIPASPELSFFSVHDLGAFPEVWARASALQPGYAMQWAAEMDALLAHGQPFVSIMGSDLPEEDHADRKARALWLKQNKEGLRAHCLAVIGIEPQAAKRMAMQAQAALMGKAFGVRMLMVASEDEARARAQELLGATTRKGL